MKSSFFRLSIFVITSLMMSFAFAENSENKKTIACHNALTDKFKGSNLLTYQVYSNFSSPSDGKNSPLIFSWSRTDPSSVPADQIVSCPDKTAKLRFNFADANESYYAHTCIPHGTFYSSPFRKLADADFKKFKLVFPAPSSKSYCMKIGIVGLAHVRDEVPQFHESPPADCDGYPEVAVKLAKDSKQKNFTLDQIQENMSSLLWSRERNASEFRDKQNVSDETRENIASIYGFPVGSCSDLANKNLNEQVGRIKDFQNTRGAPPGPPVPGAPAQK